MLQELAIPAPECTLRDGAFHAYAQWARTLRADLAGVCLLDGEFAVLEACGTLPAGPTAEQVRELGWSAAPAPRAPVHEVRDGRSWIALPVESSEGELLGGLVIECASDAMPVVELAVQLQPLLDCLRRHFREARERESALQLLTERNTDLQWLIELTGTVQREPGSEPALRALLEAARVRTRSALAVLSVPDRNLFVEQREDGPAGAELSVLWRRSGAQMTAWVRQKRRPLVLNGRGGAAAPRSKILLAPIGGDAGPVAGVLAFFRPPEAADYRQRHLVLAGLLGRQWAGMLESQFDAITGLCTREGLEQLYAGLAAGTGNEAHSVLYLDVDQMHVVNELYGFEIGNELLVRVADLLAPPHLPDTAFAAHVAADRFAVLLRDMDTEDAAELARQLQVKIGHLAIGPVDAPIDVSVSCGVAALLSLPQGLGRALAAAELACKTAKKRGRNRLKIDTCDDGTMLRRHVDAVMVGQLRSALKADQLMLYAQPIVPLRNPKAPAGYEILVRLNDPTEGVVLPGTLVGVANRYQLLPAIDRWVVRKTLQTLAVHRSVLEASGLSISINLSGQSIGDEDFTRQLGEELSAADLPPGLVTFEITEQAAVSSLARAEEMIRRLSQWNCRFALDDFGTGANSLTYLNALPIARVKIDGSFVRDILTNPRSQATVRGIVELARGFSIDTVAEFVESEAIAERVRQLGVDYAQGYAYGRPEPFEAVLEGLMREDSQRLQKLLLEA